MQLLHAITACNLLHVIKCTCNHGLTFQLGPGRNDSLQHEAYNEIYGTDIFYFSLFQFWRSADFQAP